MEEHPIIAKNLESIEQRVAKATLRADRRQNEVGLVAVSKKQPIENMLAYQELVRSRDRFAIFGENYVQEFRKKRPYLSPDFQAHLIGPLQSNKVREAVALFDVIESVHSQDVLRLIDREAARITKIQRVFLQVNISNDNDKYGFRSDAILDLMASDLSRLGSIEIGGLMAITRVYEDPEDARLDFRAMSVLGARSRALLEGAGSSLGKWDISMGMSGDFEVAIEEGATLVRIGTALFGHR